jgi:hypothetical protein
LGFQRLVAKAHFRSGDLRVTSATTSSAGRIREMLSISRPTLWRPQ